MKADPSRPSIFHIGGEPQPNRNPNSNRTNPLSTPQPQPPTPQVFFSEADPSRPSIFDIGIDSHERETVRCSGTIVSTGTGSTAWFESAAKVSPTHQRLGGTVIGSTPFPFSPPALNTKPQHVRHPDLKPYRVLTLNR